MQCPETLKNLHANNINPTYLYSYWITFYFIIYALLYLIFQVQHTNPRSVTNVQSSIKYLNPYPTIIVGSLVQLLFFVLGARVMPMYFILGVAFWKFILILVAIIILPVDWSLEVILCNIIVLGCYIIYMVRWIKINPIDLYNCIETNPDYYPTSAREFIHIRFNVP